MARQRRADVEIRANTRKYKRELRDAGKTTKRFAKDTKASLISGFKGGFGAIAALGTTAGIADIGMDAFSVEEAIVRLDIQANGEADIERIRAAAWDLSNDLGITRREVIDVATALTNRLGGAAATADRIEVLSKAMVATGASADDLATLALKLDRAFGLKSAEEWSAGLSAMIEVGKQGSVPLAEMAAVVAQSGSQYAKFGKQGKEAAAEIAALIQVAVAGGEAGGFGSASEAGTGLRAFISQLEMSEEKLKSAGVAVREMGADGQKRLRPMADILADIRKKNLVNKKGFTTLFGSVQARDFLAVLLEQEDAVNKLTQAGVDSNAVQDDTAKFMASNAGRMRKAWQGMRNEVEKLFTPERTEAMIKAVTMLGDALGYVIDHWEGFLAAFVAVKTAGIGLALFKWARASKELAGGLGLAQRTLAKLGATTTPSGLVTKALGGAMGFGVGVSVGQEIGHAIVAYKQKTFDEMVKREEEALTEMKEATDATISLLESGLVSEKGIVDPGLLKSLRVAELRGKELTPEQEAAKSALGGWDIAPSASVGRLGETGQARAGRLTMESAKDILAKTEPTERKSLVGTGESFIESLGALQEAQLTAFREALAEIAARPIVVQIGQDPVAVAVQQAPRNRRSPAQ